MSEPISINTSPNSLTETPYEAVQTPQKKKRNRKKLFAVLCTLSVLLAGITVALIYLNKWEINIQIKGDPETVVEYGEEWKDAGASASYQGSVFRFIGAQLPVETKGKVDTRKTGEYRIEYTAHVHGVSAGAQRIVKVKDTKAPVIELSGGEIVEVKAGAQWKDEFTASDNADGDISAKVKIEGALNLNQAGEYLLKYSVADESGNTATAQRTVKVTAVPITGADPAAGKDKVIYLTFDDGPSAHTARLLDILKARNVKATFFVTGNSPHELIAREAREGHAVGVHTYTHNYAQIYASDEAFWADFTQMKDVIKAQTGKEVQLMRFPGGSSNTVSKKYSKGIMSRLTKQASDRGYVYFDWNVSSGDASGEATKESVLEAMKAGVQGKRVSNVLCHDSHGYTVDAIPEFLDWAIGNGYTFLPLAPGSAPMHHGVAN